MHTLSLYTLSTFKLVLLCTQYYLHNHNVHAVVEGCINALFLNTTTKVASIYTIAIEVGNNEKLIVIIISSEQ